MLTLALTTLATAAAMAAPARRHAKPSTDSATAATADDDAVTKPRARKAKKKAKNKAKPVERASDADAAADTDTAPRAKPSRDALSATVDAIERPGCSGARASDGRCAASIERDDSATDRQTAARPLDGEADAIVVETAKPKPKKYRNEFYFVAGMAHVDARVTSGGLQLDPAGLASLAGPMGPVQGSVESDPANIVAGMIGFAPAALHGFVAFETVIGLPTTAQLRATGDLADKSLAPSALGIPTGIPPLGSQLGEAKPVPPMVTAIVRLPELGPFRFYAGGGASVLFITDAKVTNPVLVKAGAPQLDIEPALGVVGQIGVDIHIYDRFSARLDVKELWFQSSTATISNIRVNTTIPLLETVDVGSAKAEFQANPLVVNAGLRASF